MGFHPDFFVVECNKCMGFNSGDITIALKRGAEEYLREMMEYEARRVNFRIVATEYL